MRALRGQRPDRLSLLLAAFLSVGAGTASEPGRDMTAPETPEAPEVELPEVDPLAMTPEMQEFVDARIGRGLQRGARLHALMEAIFDREDGLGVEYGDSGTRTAAGTFEAATGNCLSFTLLFTAMARHVGLETYFVEVDEVTGWSGAGDVMRSHWHVYAEVELHNAKMLVDFLPVAERRYLARRRIGPRRITAHYHNNRGAESLAAGRVEEALARFERALELDPAFLPARVNLGVAHKRAGRLETAERILLAVAEADPGMVQAATNLAALYRARGRPEKARPWEERAQGYLERNPYYHFRLAMLDLAKGRPHAARVHLRRATRRKADDPAFHEKMAEASLRLGDEEGARESLDRALELTGDPEARRTLKERFAAATAMY